MNLYRQPQQPGERYCGQHGGYAPVEGGADKTFANGTRRRWICEKCVDKERERNRLRATA